MRNCEPILSLVASGKEDSGIDKVRLKCACRTWLYFTAPGTIPYMKCIQGLRVSSTHPSIPSYRIQPISILSDRAQHTPAFRGTLSRTCALSELQGCFLLQAKALRRKQIQTPNTMVFLEHTLAFPHREPKTHLCLYLRTKAHWQSQPHNSTESNIPCY